MLTRVFSVAVLIAWAAGGVSGCSAFQKMTPGSREATMKAQQAHDLQFKVMRFADEYAGGVNESLGRMQKSAITAEERLALESWKLQQAESAFTIASGPNWTANAVDMVVLATLSRMVLEDVWVKETYGERARPAVEAHVRLEKRAWELAAEFLTQDQQSRLQQFIEEWRRQNPEVRAVGYIHFNDFSRAVKSASAAEAKKSDSLFSLLRIDPFNSLDPAVREITETRQLAERTIFYLQRTPGLLDMQIERMAYAFAVMPETKALLADLERASRLGTAAEQLVATLPQTLANERHALIAQLMGELEARRGAVAEITGELRATLEAGTDTANALRATLDSFDRITARFAAKPEDAATKEKGPPFDIRQYTQMLQELAASTRELNALVTRVDGSLPAVQQATSNVTANMERLTTQLFWRLAILLVGCIVLTTAAAVAYRAIVSRQGWYASTG
ncbi:MAG TPA: hypothetical protein VFS58_01540 [Steroidobacteraceae bacterium]|nr:hypothetical protein [Steroidobacteraceae bacterium]